MNEQIKQAEANGLNEKAPKAKRKRVSLRERREIACREPLPALLRIRRMERGLKMGEMAELFGIRQSYLSQLFNGDRPFSSLSFESLRAISAFLLIPPVRVFLMAGKLRQTDLYVSAEDATSQLETAMRLVAESPFAREAGVGLAELQELSEPVKYLLMFLIQEATRSTPWSAGVQQRWRAFETTPQLSLRLNRPD